jgi:radical SAM C-methyltransferase
VWLVQQGVWDQPKESMPLAAGYLKASALADDAIRGAMDIRIFNFGGGDSAPAMAERMFRDGRPDVIAFSVFGWNYRSSGHLSETFKQLVPDGWALFGGTHVAFQGERVFRQYPTVDVVSNTEGEFVFRELLRAYLAGRSVSELDDIAGITFRREDGTLVTTADRERIQDLDTIPSPLLTGSVPLTDARGEFRYDVALMETNRGCPYRCAFCYWGGAIGQKVRAFSRDRLREEMELLAHHEVQTVVLCDANFGMLKQDLEFIEDVIRIKERYGFPRALDTSWAKNKSKVFYEIVRSMTKAGLQSSFTLALQTLDDTTLELMQRRNMRLNDWEDLVRWLHEEGLDCYAELIWGAPGETRESFLSGYDRLARYVNRIAVYPLLLMPNTAYTQAKSKLGFVTVRGEGDDFEYVMAHNEMTVSENEDMQRFLLWARALAENMVFRHIWRPLRELVGIAQSAAIQSVMDWFQASEHPSAVHLSSIRGRLGQPSAVPAFLRQMHRDAAIDELLSGWWDDRVRPRLDPALADALTEVFRYDCATRPIYDEPNVDFATNRHVDTVEIGSDVLYRRQGIRLSYDVAALLRQVQRGEAPRPAPRQIELTLYYRTGFYHHIENQEQVIYYAGRTLEGMRLERQPPEQAGSATGVPYLTHAPRARRSDGAGTGGTV